MTLRRSLRFKLRPGRDLPMGLPLPSSELVTPLWAVPAGSMGYHGIDSCVALKFGTFPTTNNTTGIYAYGAGTSDQPTASFDMTSAGINLHNGHVFSVALSYNSATFTLHQVVTDTSTNATFTHDYTIDLIAAIGGTRAYVGFTGSTANDTCTQDILTWSYSAVTDSYSAAFSAYPNYLQLFPRNRTTNTATVQVAGTESAGGFSQAVLRVYRNGTQLGADHLQALSYSGGSAPFSFTSPSQRNWPNTILNCSFAMAWGRTLAFGGRRTLSRGMCLLFRVNPTRLRSGIIPRSNAYISPYVRTFGLGTADTDGMLTYQSWFVANGGGSSGVGSLDSVGGVGQWGLVMGNLLMNNNSIPVAILNGGNGGQPSSFFLRHDAMPNDIVTNYGRLLFRMQKGGLAGSLRSLLFYQGEGDNGQAAQYQANFTALHSDWLQDYPSIERFYVFQEPRHQPIQSLRQFCRTLRCRFAQSPALVRRPIPQPFGRVYQRSRWIRWLPLFVSLTVTRRSVSIWRACCNAIFMVVPVFPAPIRLTQPTRVLTGANKNLIRIPLRNRTDTITFDPGAKLTSKWWAHLCPLLAGQSPMACWNSIFPGTPPALLQSYTQVIADRPRATGLLTLMA